MKSESGEFLSNLFLVNKKNESQRPVKNLKFLDSIPYQHFKMEVMRLMKDLHQENDLLIGMDLKDAFLAYLRAKAQESKFVFHSMGKPMRILLLIFWPGPISSDFHKTSKDPNCFIKEN